MGRIDRQKAHYAQSLPTCLIHCKTLRPQRKTKTAKSHSLIDLRRIRTRALQVNVQK
jgi:hypothetical protein